MIPFSIEKATFDSDSHMGMSGYDGTLKIRKSNRSTSLGFPLSHFPLCRCHFIGFIGTRQCPPQSTLYALYSQIFYIVALVILFLVIDIWPTILHILISLKKQKEVIAIHLAPIWELPFVVGVGWGWHKGSSLKPLHWYLYYDRFNYD